MKWCGMIGYANTKETEPGVWKELITERKYCGDVIRNFRKLQSSGNVNDNINVSNQISIIADPYATQNFHSIRYLIYMGTRWKVTDVEIQYPRLLLTLGGVYNVESTETSS